jgi:hypothetical protein
MDLFLELFTNKVAMLVFGGFFLVCFILIVIAAVAEERELSRKYACDKKEKL